ncbi:MAG: hypothetical protein K8J09_02135 [Planctomycetes bacterium]|nr:hypothetical protein [Planctomycetota bacterium]MCC7397644.1 hypothetical protein [Planctomycetota bacterium]
MEKLLELAPGPNWQAIAATVWVVLVMLVHLGFSVAVAVHVRGRTTVLVPSWLWTVATLVCGPLVAVGYWFVHASQPVGTGLPNRGLDSQFANAAGGRRG